MLFDFDSRPSDSPLVESIWRTHTGGSGAFTSVAVTHSEMVITRWRGVTTVALRGPETKATAAAVPDDAEIFGIVFRLGVYMPHLPGRVLTDNPVMLPEATDRKFWLNSFVWPLPNFENVDTFIDRLTRNGLLAREPMVEAALRGRTDGLSLRSVQRRFLHATGLTHGAVYQIDRARQAAAMLGAGTPILDVVERLGYADQPHMTRVLRQLIGWTPAQIVRGQAPIVVAELDTIPE